MQKCDNARRVPARAAIESWINLVGGIVALIDAIYTLIMKVFFGAAA
jgi:hypothetical protein